jgi:hypothetical protein
MSDSSPILPENETTEEESWLPKGPGLLLLVPIVLYMAALPFLFFSSFRAIIGLVLLLFGAVPMAGAAWKWFQETPEPGQFRSEETQSFVLSCFAASALMMTVGFLLFLKPGLLP